MAVISIYNPEWRMAVYYYHINLVKEDTENIICVNWQPIDISHYKRQCEYDL